MLQNLFLFFAAFICVLFFSNIWQSWLKKQMHAFLKLLAVILSALIILTVPYLAAERTYQQEVRNFWSYLSRLFFVVPKLCFGRTTVSFSYLSDQGREFAKNVSSPNPCEKIQHGFLHLQLPLVYFCIVFDWILIDSFVMMYQRRKNKNKTKQNKK